MRLLTRAHDREDLEDLRSLLERKGIPVRLDESGVDADRMGAGSGSMMLASSR
ncbi:MAG: hypothetical protein AB7F83_09310 [Lysobacterales bacterium]